MSKWLIGVTSTALAGLALAGQDTTQDQTEYGEDVGQQVEEQQEQWEQQAQEQQEQWEQQDPTQSDDPMTDDPLMGEEGTEATESQDPAAEMEMPHSVADMSAEELQGLTIVTATGEEVGEVDRVGHSETDQERVVTVDVGGFLGVGARTIAIPLSELEMTSDGRLQTTLTRESLETQPEFDEQGFTEEGQESTGY